MVSHFAGPGVYAPRPGVVRASGGAFVVPGLGHGASRAVGRRLDLRARGTDWITRRSAGINGREAS